MDAHEDLEEDLEEEEDEEWEEEWEEEEETQVVLGGPHGRTEYVLFRAPTMASAGYPSDADSHALGSGPGGGHPFELTFKFLRTDVKLVREVLEANGFRQTSAADFNVLWSGVTIKPHQLAELNAFQKVNRFPNMHEITRKDKLCRNLFRMREMHGARHFDFIPSTYVLPAEYDSLLAEHARVKDAVWIAKPCASSCGRGITIGAQLHHLPLDEPCVVSRYLTNPLLVDGFKFDMRLYVAVTCYEPLRLHLYEEGLARFATEKYHNSRYCLSNHYMHLTNYSVNKHSRNFVDNVDADADDYGNKWSLTALKRFLRKRGVPVELLFRRIDDLIVKTAISIEPHVLSALKAATPNRTSCFQLLGFDVFIDDALKPWLLEVNLGPSLATETPLDHRVKSSMLADLFTLCSFQPFDKRTLRDARRRHAAGAADRLSRGQPAYGRQSDQRVLAAAAASMAPASAASAPRAPLGVPAEALAAEASYPAELRRALRENDEGDAKAGRWRRLFPAASSHAYLGFFDVDRPANVALAGA
jgi:tubulin polyglutamylase TTLL5